MVEQSLQNPRLSLLKIEGTSLKGGSFVVTLELFWGRTIAAGRFEVTTLASFQGLVNMELSCFVKGQLGQVKYTPTIEDVEYMVNGWFSRNQPKLRKRGIIAHLEDVMVESE